MASGDEISWCSGRPRLDVACRLVGESFQCLDRAPCHMWREEAVGQVKIQQHVELTGMFWSSLMFPSLEKRTVKEHAETTGYDR